MSEWETANSIAAWLESRAAEIDATDYPDDESTQSMSDRAHHYRDAARGIRAGAWK